MTTRLISIIWPLMVTAFAHTDALCPDDANGLKRFGPGCKFQCHCTGDVNCDYISGFCYGGCAPGWTGPACQYRDLAHTAFSRHSDNLPSDHRYAELANDGDPGTCSITANKWRSTNNQAYWRVWLPDTITLTDVWILTLGSTLDYFRGFKILIEEIPENKNWDGSYVPSVRHTCYEHDGSSIGSREIHVRCTNIYSGNSVRLLLNRLNDYSQLVLCDVKIAATQSGRNLAFEKVSKQSSTEVGGNINHTSDIAVNGIALTTTWDYCSVTLSERNPFWEVDLGHVGSVVFVKIKNYNFNTFYGYRLWIWNQDQWSKIFDGKPTNSDMQEQYISFAARHIRIDRRYSYAIRMVLCEVELYGDCIENYCGLNCDISCFCAPPISLDTRLSGVCPTRDCLPGWTGNNNMCDTACVTGWGPNCINPCGNCANGSCDGQTGRCLNGCQNGFYGDWCNMTCGDCKNEETCNRQTGACQYGCQAVGIQPNLCQTNCSVGNYGDQCTNFCSTCRNDGNGLCSNIDGQCTSGCTNGYMGRFCNITCPGGNWGLDCSDDCGQCLQGTCNRINGYCTGSCQPGYKYTYLCVEECNDYWFGQHCSYRCSPTCEGACNKVNGTCLACKDGYQGNQCENVCDIGFWGAGCQSECGACSDRTCNHENGWCSNNGCKAGYKHTHLCVEKCDAGTYGKNCMHVCDGNCDGACESTLGTCLTCKPGYQGDFCQQECDAGTWGTNCSNTCDGCLGNACRPVDGVCDQSGCNPGYKYSHLCNEVCDNGTYGSNCSETCGKCVGDSHCRKDNGTCPGGTCAYGYVGDMCNIEALIQSPDDENDTPGNVVPAAAGGAVAAIVLAALVVLGVILYRRRKSSPMKRQDTFGSTLAHPDIAKDTNKQSTSTEKHKREVTFTNSLVHDDPNDVTGYDVRANNSEGNVYINSATVNKRDNVQEASAVNDGTYYNTEDVPKKDKSSEHVIHVQDLPAYVKRNLSTKTCFEKEFKKYCMNGKCKFPSRCNLTTNVEMTDLPYGLQHSTAVATDPGNAGKNRYQNMYAYDHSRVVLKSIKGKQYTDYINACYIDGYHKDRAYIACQGPVHAIMGDFWRMVWEQNALMIVMVTNLIEEGKMKCIQYWGEELDMPIEHGFFLVKMTKEDVYADYVIRYIQLAPKAKPAMTRTIKQFHYTAWPDKDVPDSSSSLLHFLGKVRENDEDKAHPWVVHCSAGVGRTGTFVGLDYLYEQGTSSHSVDVFSCVRKLRDQRVNMVQTQVQYQYLHKVLLEALVLPWKPVHAEDFIDSYQELLEATGQKGMSWLHLQYEEEGMYVLNDDETKTPMSDQQKKEDIYAAAKLVENKDKNRYDNILAANTYRPFLFTQVPGCNNYINAVYIQSYRLQRAYILSQLPLPNTAIDYCRLVHEQNVSLVVTFEEGGPDKIGKYLPTSGTLTLEPFVVTKISEKICNGIMRRTHTMTFNGQEQSITELVLTSWHHGQRLPPDTGAMMSLVQQVQTESKHSDDKPILVQCLNGAEKSGLLVVLLNTFERIEAENEICIPLVIRHIRHRRQQVIPNFEQFKFCHDAVLTNMENNATYANL